MICPDGFVFPDELIAVVMDYTYDEMPYLEGKETAPLVEGRFDFNTDRSFMRDILQIKTLDHILGHTILSRPFLCGPTGQCLRANVNHLFSNSFRIEGSPLDTLYLKQMTRYTFINLNLWTVDTENSTNRIDSDYWDPDEQEGFAALKHSLQRFEKWSICFKAKDIPSTPAEVRKWLEPRTTFDSTKRGGRPRLQELFAEVYSKVFPLGHRDIAYKEVINRVVSAGGPRIGEDTLRKILQRIAEKSAR